MLLKIEFNIAAIHKTYVQVLSLEIAREFVRQVIWKFIMFGEICLTKVNINFMYGSLTFYYVFKTFDIFCRHNSCNENAHCIFVMILL